MDGTPGRAAAREGALLLVATACCAALSLAPLHGGAAVTATLLGTLAATLLGTRPDSSTTFPRVQWFAVGALALLAVVRAPLGSHDLWSYAMYGRILALHGADPYRIAPGAFTHDSILHLVGRGWRHTLSAYGPVFTGYAGVAAWCAGRSMLALRLAFQVPAAAAILGSIAVAVRVSASERPIALIGLQPVVWGSVVNGGHNDAWIAFLAIAAIALAMAQRPGFAGCCIAVGALVKITAILAVPGLVLWLLARGDRRSAVRFVMASAGITALGVAAAPRSLTGAARATAGVITRASIWQVAVAAHAMTPGLVASIGIAATGAITVAGAWRARHAATPAPAVAIGLFTYTVIGAYTLPWYAVWALPAVAASRRRAFSALTTMHGGLLMSAYIVGRAPVAHRFAHGMLTAVVPIVTLLAAASLAFAHVTAPAPRR